MYVTSPPTRAPSSAAAAEITAIPNVRGSQGKGRDNLRSPRPQGANDIGRGSRLLRERSWRGELLGRQPFELLDQRRENGAVRTASDTAAGFRRSAGGVPPHLVRPLPLRLAQFTDQGIDHFGRHVFSHFLC
jgi:hypothetical protein